MKTKTVAQELKRRKDCRYGLKGVRVTRQGVPYTVDGSGWGPDGKLYLELCPDGVSPDDGYPPEVRDRLKAAHGDKWKWAPLSSAELFAWKPPPGYLVQVPARECVLASEWPVVCPCWIDDA